MASGKSHGSNGGKQSGSSRNQQDHTGAAETTNKAPVDSSFNSDRVDPRRRRMLVSGASVVGGLGALALVTPMLASMSPSERAKAAGAPVEADFSKLAPGQMLTVEWRGKPIWIVNRTKAALDSLAAVRDELSDPDSAEPQQPVYADNETRSIKPELLVMIGLCTHLGCSPTYRPDVAPADLGPDWKGGFFCPCHGSKFDFAGRVYAGVPAPTNLEVPPHKYLEDTLIVIGEDDGGVAA